MKAIVAVSVGIGAALGFIGLAKADPAGTADNWRTQRSEVKQEVRQHFQQQRQENEQFRETLKGLPMDQRIQAIIEHRKTQYQANQPFFAKVHEENMAYLKEKLASNKHLTDAEKTELITFFDSQYEENVSFREQRFDRAVAFLQQVAGDSNLTKDQKKQKIKDYVAQMKTDSKDHRQQQKSEDKSEIKKVRSETGQNHGGSAAGTQTSAPPISL